MRTVEMCRSGFQCPQRMMWDRRSHTCVEPAYCSTEEMNIAERASASSQAPETVRATLVLDKAFEDLGDEYALVCLAFLPVAILQAAVASALI